MVVLPGNTAISDSRPHLAGRHVAGARIENIREDPTPDLLKGMSALEVALARGRGMGPAVVRMTAHRNARVAARGSRSGPWRIAAAPRPAARRPLRGGIAASKIAGACRRSTADRKPCRTRGRSSCSPPPPAFSRNTATSVIFQ